MKCGKWQEKKGRKGEWERVCPTGRPFEPPVVYLVRRSWYEPKGGEWDLGIGTPNSITILPCSYSSKKAAMRAAMSATCCPQSGIK